MLLYKCIFLCYMSMERIKNLFSWPFPKFFLLLVGCDKKKKIRNSQRNMCWSWQSLYWPGSLRAVPPVCSSIHYIGFEPFLTFLFKLLVVVVWLLSRVHLLQPMDCCLPGSSVHGILQAKILEWVAISFSSSVHRSFSHIWLFVTPQTATCQASRVYHQLPEFIKLISIESVMPSNHLILCCPLLLLPSIFPSIRVFSNESALRIRWPKYWSFSISPSNEHPGLISFRMDWLDLLAVQGTLKSLLQNQSSKTSILQHSAFFIVQLSHPYMTTGKTIALTGWTFVGKVMSPLFNMLSRLVITFLPRSKFKLLALCEMFSH